MEARSDLQDEVNDSLGTREVQHEAAHDEHGSSEDEGLPKGFKERLGRQEKRHAREMRELRSQMAAMHSQQGQTTNDISSMGQPANPYVTPGNTGNDIQSHIHMAVNSALQARDAEERKAKEAASQAHVSKQYEELHKHLDKVADKYDDFDDVVRGQDVPYTSHMRDASLFLPKNGAGSAGEVLYKLGKNREELERISRLHPLDQASEMVKLSHAMIANSDARHQPDTRTLGSIKSNPVTNSAGITDKTPISELRARMKERSWKK